MLKVFKTEKRTEPRTPHSTFIEFVMSSASTLGIKNLHEIAITIDLCERGVSLCTMVPLREGQTINIVKGSPPDIRTSATVKWVKRAGSGLYKAGVAFVTE